MNDVQSYGGFVQFQLALFASSKPIGELLSLAFRFGVVKFINDTRDSEHEFRWMAEKTKEKHLEKAKVVIRFTEGPTASTFDQAHQDAVRRVAAWCDQFGKTCWVRIRTDILRNCLIDDGLSENQIRVLAALYSLIGDKPCVRADWQTIQLRAAGHLRPPIDTVPTAVRGPILSRGTIDRTCNELMDRRLVVGATFKRMERFWTNRLTADELWDAIAAIKLAKADRQLRRQRDRERSAQLEARLGAANPGQEGAQTVRDRCSGGAHDVRTTHRTITE